MPPVAVIPMLLLLIIAEANWPPPLPTIQLLFVFLEVAIKLLAVDSL